MNFSKGKIETISLAFFLAFSIVASTGLPNVNAHSPPYSLPTSAYIEVNPNPIGVGQSATVFIWVDQVFGVGFGASDSAALTNNYRFHNYNLTIIKPDGSMTSTIFNVISDPTSSQLTSFTPTQTGVYTFIFNFPGQRYDQYPGGYNPASVLVNDTYLPSSASTTLTVQSSPVPAALGSTPLPTSYWSRPIYGEGTDWWVISSNWLGSGSPVISATGSGDITAFSTGPPSYSWGSVMQRYPGDAIGPLTGHVMWTKPLQFGGIVGGNDYATQGVGWFEGSAYSQRFTNPIIMNGILYYTEPVSFTGTAAGPTDAVDLRTGQVLWSRTDVPALSFGYIYNLYDPNQHGVYPGILFTSNFARAFDAYTGDPLFNVTGVPSGYEALGPQGEHLRFVFTNLGTSASPKWNLLEWNSSRLWDFFANPWTGGAVNSPTLFNNSAVTTGGVAQQPTIGVPPTGTNVAGAGGINYNSITPAIVNGNVPLNSTTAGVLASYDWNISMPGVTISAAPNVLAAFQNNVLLCENGTQSARPGSFTSSGSWTPWTYFAIDINTTHSTFGQILWTNTIQPPAGNITVYYAGAEANTWNGNGYGVFVESHKETLNWVGYSLTTGKQIWGPTTTQVNFDYYGQPGPSQMAAQLAYGKLYCSSFGGVLYAYDLTNGNLLWTFGNGGAGNSTRAGLSVFYGDYPTFINAVGNGVIYLLTTEHTITDPIYKGALARAVNATDGAEIWTLSDYTGEFTAMSMAIADGYQVFLNGYDNQIYSVGRGPSATTLEAPMTAITVGEKAIMQGTVMDVSAGTQQTTVKADFPHGVPVASDASMKDWMGTVYQQKPTPANFNGVTVTLTAIDPNNNLIQIGTTTTDAMGMYHFSWTPPNVPGDYVITASFTGTKGYWPSTAETSMTVQSSHPTTAPTTPPQTNLATTTDLAMYIAIAIIAIIVAIAIVGALLLRKHP